MDTIRKLTCGLCHAPIRNERDGGPCEGCRNPIHFACIKPGAGPAGRAHCSVCGVNLATAALARRQGHDYAEMSTKDIAELGIYTNYSDVPWYRRSETNNIFLLLGSFGCIPLTACTCLILLTGEIYIDQVDANGHVTQWGTLHKAWAVLFAVVWTLLLNAFVLHIALGGNK